MYRQGSKVKGIITGIKSYGAFVKFENEDSGLVHISEFSDNFVKNIKDFVSIGQKVNVEIIEFDDDRKKYKLSLKKANKKTTSKRESITLTIGFKPLEKKLKEWIKQGGTNE